MSRQCILACGIAVIFAGFGNWAWSDGLDQPVLFQPPGLPADQAMPSAPILPAEPSESPSNTPLQPAVPPVADNAAAAPAPAPSSAPPADAGPKPWHLPQPCFMQQMGINMGGWVEQGITLNSRDPTDGFNGPIATNDLDRQYQLNQLWLYFVRPTKTDGCGVDIGGRIDVVYGTDWRFGQCLGLEPTFDNPNSFYGLILPQFYAEVAVNDLTVKLGHFATLTSYEVVPAPLNFFYSHSYLMTGYFDPLLVTGIQGEYKLNDNWTLISGLNRGWQEFEDPTHDWNYLGGVKWASDSKRASLSLMVDTGRQLGFNGGLNDRTSWITVYTYKISERLQYASQYTFGWENNGSTVERGDNAQWYGMDQYLFYTLNKKWSVGTRFEWVRDEDGSRIAGIGNLLGTDKGWNGLPGFTGSFTDLSFGLNYRPHPNFVLRPEIRWDWYDGPTNPAGQLPFNNKTSRSQFTTAMDAVVTF